MGKGVFNIHELAITEELLKLVLKYAEENDAQRVISINLQVGELRDFTEEWMQRYFDYLSRGTIAEGGKVVLKTIPVEMECNECMATFRADIKQADIKCPDCSSPSCRVIAGNEFIIESIGVI